MPTDSASNTAMAALPLPWQQNLWNAFVQRLDQQNLPHAFLLNGPEGIGIDRFVNAFVERLFCLTPDNNYACGTCKGCQLLKADTHSDLSIVKPDKPGRAIKVDHIRALCASLEKTAQQGGWKVAVIAPAEAMNKAAYNALLKNLEEPQPNTLIVLVSHRAGLIPATIRSRCQIENMPIPSTEAALSWLNAVAGEDKKHTQVLEIAQGLPLLALKYLQGEGIEERQQMEQLLGAVREGQITPSDGAQQCYKYDTDSALGWSMSYLHRLATSELQNKPNAALFTFQDKLNKARSWVLSGSPINTQLLWEELLMEWSQVFRQRK